MIFPQPLLIALCFAIPTYLIYFKKRHDLSVMWLATIVALDIFNSQLYMNLAAVLIFGAVTIPYLWQKREHFKGNTALKLFAIYLLYLALLGVYHGFLNPWPDPTGLRSFKDQAQMRTILHLGRSACEWFAVLYLLVQFQLEPKKQFDRFLKATFCCGIALVISAIIEKYLHIDFYHFFTGGRPLLIEGRPRGLTYEPRGLSQNFAYVMLLAPFTSYRNWKYLLIPIFAYFGFAVTVSFTGIAVLIAGIALMSAGFLYLEPKSLKQNAKKIILGVVLTGALTVAAFYTISDQWKKHLIDRSEYLTQANIAEKLEVFDAAAINFLEHHPQYYFMGTGPGLIYLPAGDYILERDKYIWGNKFEALPHMGLVLLISNSGWLGVAIWLSALLVAARQRKEYDQRYIWIVGITLCGLYFFQIRYFFILGLACLLAIPSRSNNDNRQSA